MKRRLKDYRLTSTDIEERKLIEKLCKKIDGLNKEETDKLLRDIGEEQVFLLQWFVALHHESGFKKEQLEGILAILAMIWLYYQTRFGGSIKKINVDFFERKDEQLFDVIKRVSIRNRGALDDYYENWFFEFPSKWLYLEVCERFLRNPSEQFKLIKLDKRSEVAYQIEVLIYCFEEIYANYMCVAKV